MNTEEHIKVLEKVHSTLKVMRDGIGDGFDEGQLSDIFLSHSPDTTLSGQAYEAIHFVHHALERAVEGISNVIDDMEDSMLPDRN